MPTWSPLLQEVAATPDAHQVFDSASVPGHVKDLLIVNSERLDFVNDPSHLDLLVERMESMRGGREFFNRA